MAPDVFVVQRVSEENRKSHQVGLEGPGPQWVLEVTVREELLRLRDPATDLLVPTLEESVRARREAERDAAARKRRALEAEPAALRAQLAQPDGEPP